MHFNPKGEKNSHIKTKMFIRSFYEVRGKIADFLDRIELANIAI
jgi:hypothetical protein